MPHRKAFASSSFSSGNSSPSGKQSAATALHDGVAEQPVLIDQFSFDQGVAQGNAAGHHDVLARLLLQRADVLDGITGDGLSAHEEPVGSAALAVQLLEQI